MPVIKHKQQRVGVFIDTQNLYHSAKNLHHGRVNFGEVLKKSLANRQLIRAIAYVITTESGEEKNFFDALTKMGIETKTKDLQVFSGGTKKADWDVGLAIDAVKMANKLDVIVLASGDGDFVPLVEYLKTQGCQVEVVSFGKSSSSKLIEVADDFIDLDTNLGLSIMGKNFENKNFENKTEDKAPKPIHNQIPNQNRTQTNNQPSNQNNNQRDNNTGSVRRVIRKLR